MSINVERKYIMGFLEKVFGTYSEREVKKLQSIADKIESFLNSLMLCANFFII